MSARPVLLTEDEAMELERMLAECESPLARRQYLVELIVLRALLAATRARSIRRIEQMLARLARPSFVAELALAGSDEPPLPGSERLL
jgi:hypothetical protein